MSAPMRNLFQRQFCKILNDNNLILQSSNRKCFKISQNRTFRTYADSFTRRISLKTGIFGTVIVAGSFSIGNFVHKSLKVHALARERPQFQPSREVCYTCVVLNEY